MGEWTQSSPVSISSGVATLGDSTNNGYITSPYLGVYNANWRIEFDLLTTVASTNSATGGLLCSSEYFDSNYQSKVSSNGYSGNGYAPEASALNTWTTVSWDGWNARNIYCVEISCGTSAPYSKPPVKMRNFKLYSDGFTNTFYIINYNASDNIGVTEVKYAKGNLTASYFETGGTVASGGKITVLENGTYTVYARDAAGNSTVQTIQITNIQFNITLNNQSATTAGTTSVTVTQGSTMPAITPPTKNGYTFGGYYTGTEGSGTKYYNADGTSANSFNLTANTTLYAYWTPKTIHITFNKNGGSGGTDEMWFVYGVNAFYSDSACTNQITSITNPTRSGYTFLGYRGDGTSGGNNNENYVSYTSNGNFIQFASDLCTDIYKDATLYANWQAESTFAFTYTGQFKVNSESTVRSNTSYNFTSSSWKVYLLSSGTLSVTTSASADIYVVGGGGGGGASGLKTSGERVGSYAGAGGGGGGAARSATTTLSGSYSVTIGSGGSGASTPRTSGSSGGTTSFGSIASAGGGSGGTSGYETTEFQPGSGGAGGTSGSVAGASGGGGGTQSSYKGGNGGYGSYAFGNSSFDGVRYGAGGGGGAFAWANGNTAYQSPGGDTGGGLGPTTDGDGGYAVSGGAAKANTGSGGGGGAGGGVPNGWGSGGAGGSGIAIIRNH